MEIQFGGGELLTPLLKRNVWKDSEMEQQECPMQVDFLAPHHHPTSLKHHNGDIRKGLLFYSSQTGSNVSSEENYEKLKFSLVVLNSYCKTPAL